MKHFGAKPALFRNLQIAGRLGIGLLAATLPLFAQTGTAVENMRAFDDGIQAFMKEWKIPGGALAIAKNGKLIYARGYGMADVAASQPVEPDSLFRIGSVSKTITAMGALKLVEEGKLSLDDKVFDILDEYRGMASDPRMLNITLRNLLCQSSGLVLEEDKLAPASELAAQGVKLPLDADYFIREALSQPLAFDPGTGYAYVSLNAVLTGKVIAKATNMPYETFMRTRILGPMGITRMRLARPFASQRAIGEVRYYDSEGSPEVEAYYPNTPGLVPQQYGGVPFEALSSTGAWIASPVDLVRMATAVDGSRPPRFFKTETVGEMLAKAAFWPEDAPAWYGLGWVVQLMDGDRIWWHNGATNGTAAYLMRSEAMSLDLAVTFNSMAADAEDDFFGALFTTVTGAMAATKSWPSDDLFPRYYEPSSPRVFSGGVVTAAGRQPGPIAPGQIVDVFGIGLGPKDPAVVPLDSRGAARTEVAGTRVTFNGVPAPLWYVSEGQITGAAPYGLPATGEVQIVVERDGKASEPVRLRAAASAPALFTESGDGRGQALALNSDWSSNSESNPAPQGTVIALYGTGAGRTTPESPDGKLSLPPFARIAGPVSVTIGGKPAEVVYAGVAPLLISGMFQVNVRVPADVPAGPAAVVIAVGDGVNQQDATVFVR